MQFQTRQTARTMANPSEQAGADGGADAIRNQLASIRGELFDVADADASVALILSKVRELTECENRVVEEQRCEIELLRNELEEARTRIREGQHGELVGARHLCCTLCLWRGGIIIRPAAAAIFIGCRCGGVCQGYK